MLGSIEPPRPHPGGRPDPDTPHVLQVRLLGDPEARLDSLVMELVILGQEASDNEVPTIELEPVGPGTTPARCRRQLGRRRAGPSHRGPWAAALTAGSLALAAALAVALLSPPAPRRRSSHPSPPVRSDRARPARAPDA